MVLIAGSVLDVLGLTRVAAARTRTIIVLYTGVLIECERVCFFAACLCVCVRVCLCKGKNVSVALRSR